MTREPRPFALETRGLEKGFTAGFLRGRRRVLSGIDLELPAERSLALVGPNGSGKSTLLRIFAGVERPTEGRVHVLAGTPDDPATRARIGFLADASPFPPELSATRTLELVGALRGLSREERRARSAEWLERVGLGEHAKRPLGKYSRGMLQRFGLAQCFLHDPDLVLLDEPTSGLDARGHVVLSEVLEEARRRGASLVIASHHLTEVVEQCDDVALLVDGRVVTTGPVSAIGDEAGRFRLEVEGLGPEGLARVRAAIEEEGGRVVSKGPPRDALVDWYRAAEAAAGAEGRGE